jgi:hypothetical protein
MKAKTAEERVRMRTMTVAQLIELLEGESPDALVIFSTDYGDFHHTKQALPLRGDVDAVTIEKSAYSNSGFAVGDEAATGDDAYLLIS